ncbi:MAG: hypothetical protein WB818_21650, partial [Desulfobacterales bacterium]
VWLIIPWWPNKEKARCGAACSNGDNDRRRRPFGLFRKSYGAMRVIFRFYRRRVDSTTVQIAASMEATIKLHFGLVKEK